MRRGEGERKSNKEEEGTCACNHGMIARVLALKKKSTRKRSGYVHSIWSMFGLDTNWVQWFE